jgi:hypothetical protein
MKALLIPDQFIPAVTVQGRSGKGSTYPQCPSRPDIQPRSIPFRFCSMRGNVGWPSFNVIQHSISCHLPNPRQNHHQLRRNFVIQASHHPEKVPHHPSHTPRNIANALTCRKNQYYLSCTTSLRRKATRSRNITIMPLSIKYNITNTV